MNPVRIFISSVQKELELERAAVASLIATDPFLLKHCIPVLFEKEPPSARPEPQGYLTALRSCGLYVLIIANEYGTRDGDLSATHHEYREAQKLRLPTIVFLKGAKDENRTAEVRALIDEVKHHGYKYTRFYDREDLKPLMLDALRRALAEEFKLLASSFDVAESRQLIDAASTFEATVLFDVSADALDHELLNQFNHAIAGTAGERVWRTGGEALVSRGLAVAGRDRDVCFATAAALLLFGHKPADRFPQCEVLLDAYDGVRITGRPKGQESLNGPLPRLLNRVLAFIDQQTLHPQRIVGLNSVRLDEYPQAALREALVNAVAHRSYEDRARKVFVRVFSDRVEIASPGYAPQPLTLTKLRKGGYRPCSRNPLIAQTLASLGVMEQRGTGFARMHDAMLNHGLDVPELVQDDGYFVVTLRGPAGNLDRLRIPDQVAGPVTPAMEAQLNERQKSMVRLLVAGEKLTSRRCEQEFGVTRDTAARDFALLLKLGLAKRSGRGRSVGYTQPTSR